MEALETANIDKKESVWNQNFFLLWQGRLVSCLGTQAFMIAELLWLKQVTNSPKIMGLIFFATSLTSIIFGPIGGTLADRISRKKILVLMDFLSGMLVCTFAYFIWQKEADASVLPIFILVAISLTALQAMYNPAVTSSVPDLVKKRFLLKANSLNESANQVATLGGQAIGGYLFAVLGAPILFLIDGISYIVSAISESFIRFEDKKVCEDKASENEKKESFFFELKLGVKYVWSNKGMRLTVTMAALLNLLFAPMGVILPFYVEDQLGTSMEWVGFLLSAVGLGMILGLSLASKWEIKGAKKITAMFAGLLGIGIAFGGLGFSYNPYLSLLCFLFIGIFAGFVNTHIMTTLQLGAKEEYLGRVMGVFGTLCSALVPLGIALGGFLFDLLSVEQRPYYFIIAMLIHAIITSLTFTSKEFRAFLNS